jgi:flagellar hook-associated protein 3 FlgL
VSTGLRVNSPSDDPVAAARVAHLDASLSRLDQYHANAGFARNQLGLEEEAVSEVIGTLQRVRELMLQANNATASSGDRDVIAAEIRQHRDALLAIANTTDVDGRYLFGGYRESATPFTIAAGGNVVYNGDQGQRTLQISDSRFVAVNDSGADVFQRIPEGNGTFVLSAGAANTGTGTLATSSVVNAPAPQDCRPRFANDSPRTPQRIPAQARACAACCCCRNRPTRLRMSCRTRAR